MLGRSGNEATEWQEGLGMRLLNVGRSGNEATECRKVWE